MATEVDIDSSELAGELARIVRRARKCLKGRTTDQIRAIAELSDYFVSLEVLGGRIIGERADGTDEPISMETVSDVDERGLLKVICATVEGMIAEVDSRKLDIKGSIESGEVVEIDSLTPGDLQAVHSLVQCVRASNALVDGLTRDGAMAIVIAAECVTMAELEIDHVNISSETTKVVLKTSAQNAADARWGWQRQAKQRAVEIYLSRDDWKNRTEAVKTMAPEIIKFASLNGGRLIESNAERTITGWLRESGL